MQSMLSNSAAKRRQDKLQRDLAAYKKSGGHIKQCDHTDNASYKPPKLAKGTECRRKLSRAMVRKIRSTLDKINNNPALVKAMQELANKYDVSYNTIRKVHYRQVWTGVV